MTPNRAFEAILMRPRSFATHSAQIWTDVVACLACYNVYVLDFEPRVESILLFTFFSYNDLLCPRKGVCMQNNCSRSLIVFRETLSDLKN